MALGSSSKGGRTRNQVRKCALEGVRCGLECGCVTLRHAVHDPFEQERGFPTEESREVPQQIVISADPIE